MTLRKKLLPAVVATSIVLSGIHILPSQVSAAQTGEIVKSVNFRTSPSTSGAKIRLLKSGEKVTVLDEVNKYWYKIKDRNGKVGYVSSLTKYIDVQKTTKPSPGLNSTNAEVVYGVSFRKGPSTSNARIRYLQKGERITILEKYNSYWYKVKDKNGTTGYVSTNTKYIQVDRGASINPKPAPAPSPSIPASVQMQKVIDAGMKYLGTPYEFGSDRNSTATFDCSDFVRRAFIDGIGLTLPADSRKQADYVKKVGKTTTNWRNLKPGDLLFYMAYKGTGASNYKGIDKSKQRVTHVSIYLGNGKVLHTYSKESGGVKIDSIEGRHWEHRFIFGGSVM